MSLTDPLSALLGDASNRPARVAQAKLSRAQPSSPYGPHGKMFVIAADHPARGALSSGENPLALGDRRELLTRLCRALARPEINGVLGTADILEELLLLGALEGKTVFGSMNRGGICGSVFEIDDRFTAYSAAALAASGFQGGKMLLKIDLTDPATATALAACAVAVDELAGHGLMAMVEPFLSHRADGRVVNELTTTAMIKAIGIASALGSTSAHTWLKIPVVPDMDRVLAASTLPALILGGEVDPDRDATLRRWADTLALPTACGLTVGRTLLFPPDDDVDAALDAAIDLL